MLTTASTIERLKALAWFKDHGIPGLGVRIWDGDHLAPEFVELFNLSAAEQQAIHAALESARCGEAHPHSVL